MSVHVLSPLGILYTLYALAGRPFRHRTRNELRRSYQAPSDVWWAGDDRWYPGDFPPRRGNRLVPLVDGEEAMRTMYDAMERAQESIYVAAWFLTPNMRMVRPPDDPYEPRHGKGGPTAFLPLIARKADEVDVRILLWQGALVGKFARRHVKSVREVLLHANPGIQVRLDTREQFSHCHHQKALVVDGRVAFAGGLDVTAFDADRWDVHAHTFRKGRNWHDLHWQLEGPCVGDVATNFVQRWNAVKPGDPLPLPRPAGAAPLSVATGTTTNASARTMTGTGPESDAEASGSIVQVQRTIPQGDYPFAPRGIFGIAYAYRHAIARAERFIYLENQYLWSPEITDELCDAIRRGAGSGLRIALVLPSHPNVGKGDTDRHVERLLKEDAGRGIFRPYALYTSWWDERRRRYRYRPVYVHAKVAVIDDTWATVGSANLNGRGMATDSELNLSTTDGASIRDLRLRLWSEHLGCMSEELRDADPVAILDGRWVTTAQAQQRIVTARTGLLGAAIYPYASGHVDADFGPGEIESALLDR